MSRCIFCHSREGPFRTREHILPESLGGGEWAILPVGLLCDRCQNCFGSEVEQQALDDYPFSFFRVFLGVPTKKGFAPWFRSWEGVIRASLRPGTLGYDPAPYFEEATQEGRKTQIRLLAHPQKPEMVCRFLLKMGLEVVASDSPEDVFGTKFDAARNYALSGSKKRPWWFLQCENMSAASDCFSRGVSPREWAENVRLEVARLDQEQEVFHLRLLYLDLLVPLTTDIKPELDDLPEPDYRLFWT